MTYAIRYRKDDQEHIIEWVTPKGWSTDAVRECFEQRFPAAQIISLRPQP